MGPDADRFEELRAKLRAFVTAREWDRFHSPKDLAVAVNVEAGELLEVFQWRDPSPEEAVGDERVRDEAADVLLYLMLLADKAGFDLLEAAAAKVERNERRYPVERARGSARKHTEL